MLFCKRQSVARIARTQASHWFYVNSHSHPATGEYTQMKCYQFNGNWQVFKKSISKKKKKNETLQKQFQNYTSRSHTGLLSSWERCCRGSVLIVSYWRCMALTWVHIGDINLVRMVSARFLHLKVILFS